MQAPGACQPDMCEPFAELKPKVSALQAQREQSAGLSVYTAGSKPTLYNSVTWTRQAAKAVSQARIHRSLVL